ncbi:hypothetical protein [Methylococcus mesophilus]|uniref:hypothetical protein n=1 Tax=Methylococcus mesophilus TaxID=2993564 RepID=UPI00224A8548|nr:hypothetical protein [Methylococcus mesophilus]UZR29036.1 hypothetical protein OOT43_20400 [Methylococcus mesophilus]
MNTIAEKWATFEREFPSDLPPAYRLNLRIAFYAGAEALLRIHGDIADYSDAGTLAVIEGVFSEIQSFRASTIRAYLETRQGEAVQ